MDPAGVGRGSLENDKLYGFLQGIRNWTPTPPPPPPIEKRTPHPPPENVGPHLEPLKIIYIYFKKKPSGLL